MWRLFVILQTVVLILELNKKMVIIGGMPFLWCIRLFIGFNDSFFTDWTALHISAQNGEYIDIKNDSIST